MSGQENINIDGTEYPIGAFSQEAQQAIYHLQAIKIKLNELEATKQHYEMAYTGFANVVNTNLPDPATHEEEVAVFNAADEAKAAELGDN